MIMDGRRFPRMTPKRLVTMSMPDNYLAVCIIYDGIQYQNLCRDFDENGSLITDEKCLQQLTHNLPYIGYEQNTSLIDETGLALYDRPEPADFPDILSAISHYWIEVLMLCLLSALALNIVFLTLKGRSLWFGGLMNTLLGRKYFKTSKQLNQSIMPTVDEFGTISIGKLSFNQKSILGYGSKGTCVFKGTFEKSLDCAVKRVVSQYLNIADREVEFLRSLQNPHLVRYLATEEDGQFIYIALELAEFTLADIIDNKMLNDIGLGLEKLCYQSALGLQYLHNLDIVHRDIKPQNILISFPMKPNNERKIMISDFGVSKQLSNLDTGHTSYVMRYFDGTQGWMAPEIVNAILCEDKTLLPTKSADIFSLGCTFYYIVSNGGHPFGPIDQRQSNILKNSNSLDSFKLDDDKMFHLNEEQSILARKLIKAMIQPKPEQRPPINSILKYPFFWSKTDQLQFLQDVSDRIDKEEGDNELIYRIERNKQKIFAFGWKACLSSELQNDLGTFRKYNERSVRHLLRAIRNKKHHYRESSDEVKASLGEIPEGFMSYFSSRFPELLPHIYQAMQTCKSENIFKLYYEPTDNFIFE